MEQRLERITKLAPRPWWAAIAPLLMAAGLIFPPLGLWLVFQHDAVEANLKASELVNDRLTAMNASLIAVNAKLQERLHQFEGPSAIPSELPDVSVLPERDRSSACHACASPHAFDRRLEMTLFRPAGWTACSSFGMAAMRYELHPFAQADLFWPDGI